jgi:hypothetical protein
MKIISGGQTGADIGALLWAKDHGFHTGGWMPHGFRTDDGPCPHYADLYNMRCTRSYDYPPRTRLNVLDSDYVLVIGNPFSPGCKLTIKLARSTHTPCLIVAWPDSPRHWVSSIRLFQLAIAQIKPSALMVAGNRERKNPGIATATMLFLSEALL